MIKKIVVLILVLFSYVVGIAQPVTARSSSVVTVMDSRFFAQYNFRPPVFPDTTAANVQKGLDSCGALIFTYDYNGYWYRACSPKRWIPIVGGSGGVFKDNIILNAGAGNRLGYWVDGDTIPVAGMALDSAFKVITQKAVPPVYNNPTASIGSSPTQGNYEIGSNISVTLSSTFTQNDAGSQTGQTYYKGVIELGGNTDNIPSLTTPTSYSVQISYGQGACKNNNFGVPDCTGRIEAGTVSSSSITFNPQPKVYWGYLLTNSTPSSADILATLGGGSQLATTRAGTFTTAVSGSNRYLYYAYPTSFGALTSLTIGGFQTLPAFSPAATVSVTNAQGYVQNYYVYINRGNPQNAGSVTIVTQ